MPGAHACDIPVLELDSSAARVRIGKQCTLARDTDGCDTIVLGCAGMTDLADELGRDLGIPVVDGVAAATKTVESLIALGLRTSPRGEYGPPPPKPYHGLLASFALARS